MLRCLARWILIENQLTLLKRKTLIAELLVNLFKGYLLAVFELGTCQHAKLDELLDKARMHGHKVDICQPGQMLRLDVAIQFFDLHQ